MMNRTRRAILTTALTLAATLALATPAAASDNCNDAAALEAVGLPATWGSYSSLTYSTTLSGGAEYLVYGAFAATDDGTNPGNLNGKVVVNIHDNSATPVVLAKYNVWQSNWTVQKHAVTTVDMHAHLVYGTNITNTDGDALADDAMVVGINITVPSGYTVGRYLVTTDISFTGQAQMPYTWDGTSTGTLGYVTESTDTTRRYAWVLNAATETGCPTNTTGGNTSTGNADSTRIATGVVSTLAQWVPVVVLFTLLGIAMSAIGLGIFGTKKME